MARLEIIVDSGNAKKNVDDVTKSLSALESAGNRVDGATSKTGRGMSQMGDEAKKTNDSIAGLNKSVIGLVAGGLGVAALIKAADGYANIQNKLKLVTSSQYELGVAYKSVFSIAQETRQSLESTVDVYQKFAQQADVLGISQAKVASLTKTVAQAVAVSGSSAASSAAAIMQFGQALASGVFRGDEFNSVAEQSPALLKTLAVGLDKTTGELRTMAAAGLLTSDVLLNGLTKGAKYAEDQFKKTASTIGQAVEQFNNAKIDYLGNQTSGGAKLLAESLSLVAHNFGLVAGSVEVLVAGGLTLYLANTAKALYVETSATVANLMAKRASVAANLPLLVAEAREATLRATNAKAAATEALAIAENTGSKGFNTIATNLAATATIRETEARIAGTAATAAAGVGVRGLLGLLGGPVGLALTVAGTAAAYLLMSNNTKETKLSMDQLAPTLDKQIEKMRSLDRATREKVITDSKNAVQIAKDASKAAGADVEKGLNILINFESNPQNIAQLRTALQQVRDPANDVSKVLDRLFDQKIISSETYQQLSAAGRELKAQNLTIRERTEAQQEAIKTNKEQIALEKLDPSFREKLEAQKQQEAIAKRQIAASKITLDQNTADAKQKLSDAQNETNEARARVEVEKMRNQVQADGSIKKVAIDEKSAAQYIEQSRQLDIQKDKTDNLNKTEQQRTAALAESTRELEKQKTAYANLLDSQLDPIEAINKKYREQIDLIDKAMAGRFKATGAAATAPRGAIDFKLTSPINVGDEGGVLLPAGSRVAFRNEKELKESLTNLSKEQAAQLLAQYQKYLANKDELFQKSSSAERSLSKEEGAARKAIINSQNAAEVAAHNIQYTSQLAALSDYAKSAQDILEEKHKADLIKNEGAYLTDVNGAQKRADMLIAIDKKYAHDSAAIVYQRELELQAIRDRAKTAQEQSNINDAKLNMSPVQAALFDKTSSIQTRATGEINQNKDLMNAPDVNQATRDQLEAKNKLIQEYADKEARIEENSVAYKRALQDEQLNNVAGLFGNLAVLQQSSSKELAAIGKAAAIAQATIDGILAVQKALATIPPPLNFAVAGAIGVSAAVNVAKIAGIGFADGGYTGAGSKYDPAGIVHKGEVVWSQDDIRRAGGVDAVESMRRGMQNNYMQDVAPQRSSSQNVTQTTNGTPIHIHNHGIDQAIEDWFKGSSSDRHFVNKFERNKSSVSRVLG